MSIFVGNCLVAVYYLLVTQPKGRCTRRATSGLPHRLAAALGATVLAAAMLVAVGTTPVTASRSTTRFRFADITGSDGTVFKANVIESTSRPAPAIVFADSWGLGDLEYLA